MRKKLFIFMSLVLVMLPGLVLSAPLVTNGGFETGDFTGWTQSGDTSFTGVDPVAAHSGNYGAYFGPIGDLGYISQTLSTTPGGTYDLSLWLENLYFPPDEFVVKWNGNIIQDLMNVDAFSYTQESFSDLIATSSSTELQFGLRQDPSYFYLDDVSVTPSAVPEPTTLLLLGSGLIGLAGYGRKKFFKK